MKPFVYLCALFVNIHTADNPGGVARGQLTAAQ